MTKPMTPADTTSPIEPRPLPRRPKPLAALLVLYLLWLGFLVAMKSIG